MSDITMLYQLIVLYMLDRSKEPLSNTQITIFVLDQEYTGYFSIQKAIRDLETARLIDPIPAKGNTFYRITAEGRQTLAAYRDRISSQIKADIDIFLESSGRDRTQKDSCRASYSRRKDGSYMVTCEILSGPKCAMTLSLEVAEEEQAEAVCRSWREQHIELYTNLMYTLLR